MDCPTEIAIVAQENARASSSMGAVTTGAAAVSVASTASGPSAFSIVILTKFLIYIRYIKVRYSPELFLFLKNYDASSISFGIQAPTNVKEETKVYPMPENFEIYEDNSSFLINYWETLMTLIIIFGLYLTLSTALMIFKSKGNKNLILIFERMRIILGSNLFLLIFCGAYDEVTLYASL